MSSEPPAAAAVLMVVGRVVVEVGDGGCVEEGEDDGAVPLLSEKPRPDGLALAFQAEAVITAQLGLARIPASGPAKRILSNL